MKKIKAKRLIGKQQFKIVCFVTIQFFANSLISADLLDDASGFEKNGDFDKAVLMYNQWLSANSNDSRFLEILIYSTSLEKSAHGSISKLLSYESYINNNRKQSYYLRIAQLYELIFNLEQASIYYEKSSTNSDNTRNIPLYLKYLKLRYQLGDIPELIELNNILLSNIDDFYHVEALIFKSEILKYNNQYLPALNLLLDSEYKYIYPEIMLAIWELYRWKNNYDAALSVERETESFFPDSIEVKIMKGEIGKISRLSDFFIRGSEKKSYIQVGVFSNKDNAVTLCETLENNNFSYIIDENGSNSIIIIESILSENDILRDLEDKGIDGFPIEYP